MDPLYWLMLMIWVIGWMFAAGGHREACERLELQPKWPEYLVLGVMWPQYVGVAWSARGRAVRISDG